MDSPARRLPNKEGKALLVPIAICIGWTKCDGLYKDFPMFNLMSRVYHPSGLKVYPEHATMTMDSLKECLGEDNVVFAKKIRKNTYVYKKVSSFVKR